VNVRKTLGFVTLSAVIVMLMGCATHKQAFDRTANQEIKTIAMLEPAYSGEYMVMNFGHAGMAFGLIGGVIAAADMQSKTNDFTEMMKVRDFKIVEEFENALTGELQNAGYTVKLLKVRREKPKFLDSYDALDKDADAYLDLRLGAGYFCASAFDDYVPMVSSGVRLVKRGTNDVAYQDLIGYGYEPPIGNPVIIAADKKYCFEDFDALKKEPDRAMEGLRKGVPLVAKRIAQDLTK
jgi:hypothetical protein